MTFVSVQQKDLQQALSICNQISPKKSDIELFTYSKITILPGFLQVSALSSSVFYTTKIATQQNDISDSSINFVIKTDLFASSVALISDEIIGLEIDTDKQTLIIQGSKSKHTLRINLEKADEFSQPAPKPDELTVKTTVKSSELIEASRVSFTTVGLPKSVYQQEFLNICFTMKPADNSITVVSCDKFRISKTRIEATFLHTSEDVTTSVNFLVPPKAVQLLTSVIESHEQIDLDFEKSMVWANFGNSILVIRYGEGVYPDYDKIIPQSFTCTFSLVTKDAREALKQVFFTAKANVVNKAVIMNIDPAKKKIVFVANADDGFSSESTLDLIQYEGVQEAWNQTFNAEYLLDYVQLVTTDNLLVEANPGKPLVMSPEGQKARQLCLVQGLR